MKLITDLEVKREGRYNAMLMTVIDMRVIWYMVRLERDRPSYWYRSTVLVL